MTVCFCGHREIADTERVRVWLYRTIEQLIQQGASSFLLGGYGEFDLLCASVLREMKNAYPQIKLLLVLAYLDKKQEPFLYDGSLYPPLEKVPKRYAIVHRNRWMVEQSDCLVAYVEYSWGGAAQTLRHAEKKGKRIYHFPQ